MNILFQELIHPAKLSASNQKMEMEENLGVNNPTRRVPATPTRKQPHGDEGVKKGKYLSHIKANQQQKTKNYRLEYFVLFPQNQILNNCIT